MLNNLLFSCVIVSYNRTKYLNLLLSDISKQKMLPNEVIIVNNGNEIIIDNFNLPVKIIKNTKNSLTSGRNLGLKNVKNKYVFFFWMMI